MQCRRPVKVPIGKLDIGKMMTRERYTMRNTKKRTYLSRLTGWKNTIIFFSNRQSVRWAPVRYVLFTRSKRDFYWPDDLCVLQVITRAFIFTSYNIYIYTITAAPPGGPTLRRSKSRRRPFILLLLSLLYYIFQGHHQQRCILGWWSSRAGKVEKPCAVSRRGGEPTRAMCESRRTQDIFFGHPRPENTTRCARVPITEEKEPVKMWVCTKRSSSK